MLLIAGLGTGPAMGGITIAAQNSVPSADMGTATAGSVLTKQIGGAFGLACAQSLMSYHGTAATTVSAIGSTIAWGGAAAGVLALAAVFLMHNIPIPVPRPHSSARPPGRRSGDTDDRRTRRT